MSISEAKNSGTSPDEVYEPRPLDGVAIPVQEDGVSIEEARRSFFDFRDHHGFEKHIESPVNSSSTVMVSITETSVEGGVVVPVQGAASLEVHNVVPRNDTRLIVRGFIHWDHDIPVRLNIFRA